MNLGEALFASVVLVLAVYHKGFRKVLLWTVAVAVALALLAAACYFGYDRYTTWQADREAQRQKAVIAEGIKACMLRLGTPMPKAETASDSRSVLIYVANLGACQAYPDVDIAARTGPGFEGGSLPPGYTLDPKGKVTPIPQPPAGFVPTDPYASIATPVSPAPTELPPGAIVGPHFDMSKAKPILKPKKEPGLEATITCDVVVYDRDKFGFGDSEAIASLHTGDTIKYIGHVTVGDQEIIRVHGRKGYVDGCVDVKQ
jgi:hypothetical protein